MTTDQIIVFSILAVTLALFIYNRWRYDVVAVMALLALALFDLVPAEQLFLGFGHPAVITVAAVLLVSRGLINAGVVDSIARQLLKAGDNLLLQLTLLTVMVALASAFMNNVGALALLMPVAVWMARQHQRSPSILLMPLAFGSLLGGTLTLIGTPTNIIVASYRKTNDTPAFGMFDFLPVGLAITLAGLVFIVLLGWRLTPSRQKVASTGSLFEVSDYVTEVSVSADSNYCGKTLHALLSSLQDDADIAVLALIRADRRHNSPSTYFVLRENDTLLLEADPDSLQLLLQTSGFNLSANKDTEDSTPVQQQAELMEVVVTPASSLIGRSAATLALRERHGVNLLAVARQGKQVRQRLSKIQFVAGDILLVQQNDEDSATPLAELGCLPLAARGLKIGKTPQVLLASCIFIVGLALIALSVLPAATALLLTALVMLLSGILKTNELYSSIDMPVIVLLAAMLPLGMALESSGGSALIANTLLDMARQLPALAVVALLMAATMLLSNIINNAATAVLTAPIAIKLAEGLELSADPFLMAVAVGASCAFLTPIGHQSNALVMAPGGYKFGDYWRMGLPLSILVLLVAVPVIALVWPLA
ncbi:SLC13 family permease [Rheinheimera nanhaiensis]|uniref:Sodium/sulfate symporter family protein n=1 Tax=Rheinheimera nanhaiensis E407-8 TaxID=562729 RepID=I1DYV0_9GAMM|nr:SLC13 family permease [Rheinheimera nanhaiensis]GAB59228.1 sodium/sulfate symporter family protein [Rheinheimera nanhaiensis E407-8]